MFEMEICNDNYGRTKIDDINGEMRKTQNIKKGIIEKKDLYWLLIWLLWNISLNEDNLWDMPMITGETTSVV